MDSKLILIGPKTGLKGGATVSFGYLLDELDRRSVSYTLIDTGTEKRGVLKIFGFIRDLLTFNREIEAGSTISLHASNTRALIYSILLHRFAKRTGSRLFVRLFGGNYPEFLSEKPAFIQKMALKCYREQTLMLQTRGMIGEFTERFGEANLTWFPTSRPMSGEEGPERADASGRVRMIYAGHICRKKGIDLILDAGRKAAGEDLSIKFDLYGEITEEEYREKLEQYPHDNMEYHGVVDSQELMAEMRQADLLVFTSTRDREGYPGVIIEAINMNLPVLATRLKHNHELIEDGVDGILYDEARPEQFWEQIRELCNHPEKLKQLQQGLRDKETKFSSHYWNGEYFLSLVKDR